MVDSHPWLLSAIGEVEQKLRTKQVKCRLSSRDAPGANRSDLGDWLPLI